MRSSKSRSRNKNRNRPSGGNIINRVFDSSGPEGKVRGTPQQIIDKYNQLARDAQLAGDRVATENFQQHAEHYTRLLAQAQKEMDAKREQQHHGGGQNQQHGGGQNQPQGGGNEGQGQNEEGGGNRGRNRGRGRGGDGGQPVDTDVIDAGGDSGLVETPEAKADAQQDAPAEAQAEAPAEKPKRRPRKKAKADAPTEEGGPTETAAE